MAFRSKTTSVLISALLLLAPILFVLPNISAAFAASRQPNVISTTLALDDGTVVTVQYSQIYFCNNGFGQDTSTAANPCKVGLPAVDDPTNDKATHDLNVIVPAFLDPLPTLLGGGTTCSDSDLTFILAGTGLTLTCSATGSVFNPGLGANNFAQCPDNTSTLTCPNHPEHLDLTPTTLAGNVPLPIHTHIISGQGATFAQGGWWELKAWLVLDSSIWPKPKTGTCTGSPCLNSDAALASAATLGKVVGVPTTVYLFFNVVSTTSK